MRLVDADEILKIPPFTKAGGLVCDYVEGYLDCVEDAISAINDAPTVDVVEVVRCKDCRHYVAPQGTYVCDCFEGMNFATNNDFCSYGERRYDDEVPINR